MIFHTDNKGALVDITAKSSAHLKVEDACMHKIKHVEEVGLVPGVKEEFVIIGENEDDDSLILSLKTIQFELAWERCRQLQAEDVVVKGRVRICFSARYELVSLTLCVGLICFFFCYAGCWCKQRWSGGCGGRPSRFCSFLAVINS